MTPTEAMTGVTPLLLQTTVGRHPPAGGPAHEHTGE
jgi:hypothetical protein